MRLEYELEIRGLACSILPNGIGMDIGNGWRDIALDAVIGLVETSHGRVKIQKVGEKFWGLDIRLDVRAIDDEKTIGAIFEITGLARARSMDVCELCGRPGEIRRVGWHRVRCDGCEAEHVRRHKFVGWNRKDIAEAAAYYIGVCLEHGRLFPVGNIMIQLWPDDIDRRHFVDEVNDTVCWWRAGSMIQGVNEELREAFRRLRFR